MSIKSSKLLSIGLVFTGLLLVINAGFPVLYYEFYSSSGFEKPIFLSPISEGQVQGVSVAASGENLVNPSSWFVDAPQLPNVATQIKYYNLSIPKLGIKSAVVEIGGDNLSKNLIQYKGTALPGHLGNAVVFGHSTLPQLFRPDNYLSIFATLPTLKVGDEIIVDYDGITYTYRIEDMFEVKPTDIKVLEQQYDDGYLSVITCVPPGTYLRRLVVKARLIPFGKK